MFLTGVVILPSPPTSKRILKKPTQIRVKNIYDNQSKLLFTDIDSSMYEIKTEDTYEDFTGDKEMFDFSNYSTK